MKTQQNNRRNNHVIPFRGETHTISEWGEITGIGQANISARLKLGWDAEKALTEAVKSIKKEVVNE